MALVPAFLKPLTFVEFLPVPVDAFNMCTAVMDLKLMLIPSSLGTVFGTSLRWLGSSPGVPLLTVEYT